MKKSFICIASTTLAVIFSATSAHAQTEKNLINELSACSPSFFKYIKDHQNQLSLYAPIQAKGEFAHFQVKNRTASDPDSHDPQVLFTQTLDIDGLKIVGYIDEVVDLSMLKAGFYHSWGFLINNSADAVAKRLNNVSLSQPNTGLYIGNPQIIRATKSSIVWDKNNMALSGTVPGINTAEKLLMIEKTQQYTRLVCSIQGSVTPMLLKQERPDL